MSSTGGRVSQGSANRIDDILPPAIDRWVFGLVLSGMAVLYGPTVRVLALTVWNRDEQGHGPIILAIVIWLLYSKRHELAATQVRPALGWGLPFFVIALLLFILGRSQEVLLLEVGSVIPLLVSLLLIFRGAQALRLCWFPLFFLIFAVPLPATLVIWVTTPLKTAVSAVASDWLYALGYPVGRSGVILTVGAYQLLVADACAGLNSMFTLEALGLLYMNLMRYASARRNVFLALMIVPISFLSNIVRVMILVLVTYHFGDEAGQGFVHGFAGMVLFLVALTLILTVDHGMNWVTKLGKTRP
jgi:exosortase B